MDELSTQSFLMGLRDQMKERDKMIETLSKQISSLQHQLNVLPVQQGQSAPAIPAAPGVPVSSGVSPGTSLQPVQPVSVGGVPGPSLQPVQPFPVGGTAAASSIVSPGTSLQFVQPTHVPTAIAPISTQTAAVAAPVTIENVQNISQANFNAQHPSNYSASYQQNFDAMEEDPFWRNYWSSNAPMTEIANNEIPINYSLTPVDLSVSKQTSTAVLPDPQHVQEKLPEKPEALTLNVQAATKEPDESEQKRSTPEKATSLVQTSVSNTQNITPDIKSPQATANLAQVHLATQDDGEKTNLSQETISLEEHEQMDTSVSTSTEPVVPKASTESPDSVVLPGIEDQSASTEKPSPDDMEDDDASEFLVQQYLLKAYIRRLKNYQSLRRTKFPFPIKELLKSLDPETELNETTIARGLGNVATGSTSPDENMNIGEFGFFSRLLCNYYQLQKEKSEMTERLTQNQEAITSIENKDEAVSQVKLRSAVEAGSSTDAPKDWLSRALETELRDEFFRLTKPAKNAEDAKSKEHTMVNKPEQQKAMTNVTETPQVEPDTLKDARPQCDAQNAVPIPKQNENKRVHEQPDTSASNAEAVSPSKKPRMSPPIVDISQDQKQNDQSACTLPHDIRLKAASVRLNSGKLEVDEEKVTSLVTPPAIEGAAAPTSFPVDSLVATSETKKRHNSQSNSIKEILDEPLKPTTPVLNTQHIQTMEQHGVKQYPNRRRIPITTQRDKPILSTGRTQTTTKQNNSSINTEHVQTVPMKAQPLLSTGQIQAALTQNYPVLTTAQIQDVSIQAIPPVAKQDSFVLNTGQIQTVPIQKHPVLNTGQVQFAPVQKHTPLSTGQLLSLPMQAAAKRENAEDVPAAEKQDNTGQKRDASMHNFPMSNTKQNQQTEKQCAGIIEINSKPRTEHAHPTSADTQTQRQNAATQTSDSEETFSSVSETSSGAILKVSQPQVSSEKQQDQPDTKRNYGPSAAEVHLTVIQEHLQPHPDHQPKLVQPQQQQQQQHIQSQTQQPLECKPKSVQDVQQQQQQQPQQQQLKHQHHHQQPQLHLQQQQRLPQEQQQQQNQKQPEPVRPEQHHQRQPRPIKLAAQQDSNSTVENNSEPKAKQSNPVVTTPLGSVTKTLPKQQQVRETAKEKPAGARLLLQKALKEQDAKLRALESQAIKHKNKVEFHTPQHRETTSAKGSDATESQSIVLRARVQKETNPKKTAPPRTPYAQKLRSAQPTKTEDMKVKQTYAQFWENANEIIKDILSESDSDHDDCQQSDIDTVINEQTEVEKTEIEKAEATKTEADKNIKRYDEKHPTSSSKANEAGNNSNKILVGSTRTSKQQTLKCEAVSSASALLEHGVTNEVKETETFTCDHCGRSFEWLELLQIHMKEHTGEKPFECEICHKKFTWTSNLVNHMKTHSEVKQYKCKTCKTSYKTSWDLKRHIMFIHSHSIIVTRCGHCRQTFKTGEDIKQHLRSHLYLDF